jgi:hypothetical protein
LHAACFWLFICIVHTFIYTLLLHS